MTIPLTRLHLGELPSEGPLPFPVFSKSGRLLLAAGSVFPENLAHDLLAVGIYRLSDESTLDSDIILGDDESGRRLRGLTANVESMQFNFQEPDKEEPTSTRVDYLGMIPEVSLITRLPQRSGRVIDIGVGQNVLVRICTGRYIHGFNSQVICSYKFPTPHVHLNYPSTVKTIVLRNSERVKLRLLALLKKGEDVNMLVSIEDFSREGAALMSEFDFGTVGDVISLNFTLHQDGHSYSLAVTGIIRQVRAIRTQKRYRYGVELVDLTDEQKQAIHAFIYENL